MQHTYDTSAPKPLPKKIHFIWVGDNIIPEKYMRTMLALSALAKRDGFEFNLWMDNKNIYDKSLDKLDRDLALLNVEKHAIRLRDINELKPRMIGDTADDFYRGRDVSFPLELGERDRGKNFWKYLDRERVGSKNLAAASDFLRYEVLRQEGGYYFDTDTEFPQLAYNNRLHEITLQEDSPPFGMILSCQPKISEKDGYVRIDFQFSQKIANDIFGFLPQHKVLKNVLTKLLIEYRQLDDTMTNWDKNKTSQINYKSTVGMAYEFAQQNMMDKKRYPVDKARIFLGRRLLTISASGPGLFKHALESFFPKPCNLIAEIYHKTFTAIDGEGATTKIAGLKAVTKSDQTWLSNKNQIKSYDTASIPRHLEFRKRATSWNEQSANSPSAKRRKFDR